MSEVLCIDCLRYLKARLQPDYAEDVRLSKRKLATVQRSGAPELVIPYRCVTHYREMKKRRSATGHERMVQKVYGLEPGEYERLYKIQGGVCYICRRAKGKARRLAVDHDHSTGVPRGLLCSPCNKNLIGLIEHIPGGWAVAVGRIANYLAGQTPYAEMKEGS